MANKPNLYRGLLKEAEPILCGMEQCVLMWKVNNPNQKEILAYFTDEAENIRDSVCKIQGKLELALSGLDKNSNKRHKYQRELDLCTQFLEVTKNNK